MQNVQFCVCSNQRIADLGWTLVGRCCASTGMRWLKNNNFQHTAVIVQLKSTANTKYCQMNWKASEKRFGVEKLPHRCWIRMKCEKENDNDNDTDTNEIVGRTYCTQCHRNIWYWFPVKLVKTMCNLFFMVNSVAGGCHEQAKGTQVHAGATTTATTTTNKKQQWQWQLAVEKKHTQRKSHKIHCS